MRGLMVVVPCRAVKRMGWPCTSPSRTCRLQRVGFSRGIDSDPASLAGVGGARPGGASRCLGAGSLAPRDAAWSRGRHCVAAIAQLQRPAEAAPTQRMAVAEAAVFGRGSLPETGSVLAFPEASLPRVRRAAPLAGGGAAGEGVVRRHGPGDGGAGYASHAMLGHELDDGGRFMLGAVRGEAASASAVVGRSPAGTLWRHPPRSAAVPDRLRHEHWDVALASQRTPGTDRCDSGRAESPRGELHAGGLVAAKPLAALMQDGWLCTLPAWICRSYRVGFSRGIGADPARLAGVGGARPAEESRCPGANSLVPGGAAWPCRWRRVAATAQLPRPADAASLQWLADAEAAVLGRGPLARPRGTPAILEVSLPHVRRAAPLAGGGAAFDEWDSGEWLDADIAAAEAVGALSGSGTGRAAGRTRRARTGSTGIGDEGARTWCTSTVVLPPRLLALAVSPHRCSSSLCRPGVLGTAATWPLRAGYGCAPLQERIQRDPAMPVCLAGCGNARMPSGPRAWSVPTCGGAATPPHPHGAFKTVMGRGPSAPPVDLLLPVPALARRLFRPSRHRGRLDGGAHDER